jgi:hypothetical protein
MKPTGKDHKGRLNYFSFQEFIENCKKYHFDSFPVITSEGSKNIYNIEYEEGEEKRRNGWQVSKSNFNLILTNQPDNSPCNMTKSTSGNFDDFNGFVNASYCFLDYKTFLDFLEIAKQRPSEFEKFTHMRFVTKNLEAKFDSFYFWFDNLNDSPLDRLTNLKKDYKYFVNIIYVNYLNDLNNEELLKEINKISNNYKDFFDCFELEEKEIFYNKTNQFEK